MSTREHFIFQSNDVGQLLAAAGKAAQERDFPRSIELLEAAARRSPRNSNIFFSLGTMQGKCCDFVAVEKSFDQAIDLSPDVGQALISAGGRCLAMGNEGLAEKYFTRATQLFNPHPVAFVGLADVCERRERFSEVTGFVEQALRIDPANPSALLFRARSLRRAGSLKEAEAVLVRLAAAAESKVMLRVEAGCELARVLDLQKNYDAAMAAAVAAKALLKPPSSVRQTFRNLTDRRQELERCGLAKKMEKWLKSEELPVPLVLAGGRPYACEKIGIERGIASHEGVFYLEDSRIFLDEIFIPAWRRFPLETSVVSFFDSLTPDMLREMRATYLRRSETFLQKPIGDRVIVEKNHVLNFFLFFMIRVFPEARLMLTMRDPRDACLESFMQFQPVNPCSCGFLTLADSVAENMAALNHWRTIMEVGGHPHMQVRLEDVAAGRDLMARQAFSFLKVNPVSISSPIPAAPSWSIGNWKNYRKYLEPHLAVLDVLAETFGY